MFNIRDTAEGYNEMPPKFDLLGIITQDMAASLAFYRLLGWDIPAEADNADHAEYTLPNGLRIGWDTHETIRSFNPDWQPSEGHAISLAFLCDSPAEVDSLYARLTGTGYEGHTPPFDAFWGQRYAYIKDPDGNLIDLFAPLS